MLEQRLLQRRERSLKLCKNMFQKRSTPSSPSWRNNNSGWASNEQPGKSNASSVWSTCCSFPRKAEPCWRRLSFLNGTINSSDKKQASSREMSCQTTGAVSQFHCQAEVPQPCSSSWPTVLHILDVSPIQHTWLKHTSLWLTSAESGDIPSR